MNFLQSEPGQEPVEISGVFDASPSRVFKAWSDPVELKKWFGPHPNSLLSTTVDLQVDGKWAFVVEDSDEKKMTLQGKYQEIVVDKRLVFTWTFLNEFPDGRREETAESIVTVNFFPEDGSTRIELKHEAVNNLDGRLGVHKGWNACFNNFHTVYCT